MKEEVFRDAVKNDGWIIKRKSGHIYFKRRDQSKAYNQGAIYSCHTKDMDTAIKTIQDWILHGFPKTKNDKEPDLIYIDFLYEFWNLDGLYFRTANLDGRHITKAYIAQNRMFIRLYAEPFFKDTRLSKIDEKILNDFIDYVIAYVSPKTGRHLVRASVSRIKASVLQPLKWGRQKGIVKQHIDFMVVCPGLGKKSPNKRGILTYEETQKLLLHKWDDVKAYIAFCIAVNCGLRVGEIRALKIGNIKKGFIVVSNSFNDYDGFKCTKNGKVRIVPCPDDVLQLIADYVSGLPEDERGPDCYLLTHDYRTGEPLNHTHCIKKFYRAMKQCGIERIRTNPLTGEKEIICFHSLRHQTATRWVESGLDLRLIAQAMGHTIKMLEHYSDHLNLNDMELLRQELSASNSLGAAERKRILIEKK